MFLEQHSLNSRGLAFWDIDKLRPDQALNLEVQRQILEQIRRTTTSLSELTPAEAFGGMGAFIRAREAQVPSREALPNGWSAKTVDQLRRLMNTIHGAAILEYRSAVHIPSENGVAQVDAKPIDTITHAHGSLQVLQLSEEQMQRVRAMNPEHAIRYLCSLIPGINFPMFERRKNYKHCDVQYLKGTNRGLKKCFAILGKFCSSVGLMDVLCETYKLDEALLKEWEEKYVTHAESVEPTPTISQEESPNNGAITTSQETPPAAEVTQERFVIPAAYEFTDQERRRFSMLADLLSRMHMVATVCQLWKPRQDRGEELNPPGVFQSLELSNCASFRMVGRKRSDGELTQEFRRELPLLILFMRRIGKPRLKQVADELCAGIPELQQQCIEPEATPETALPPEPEEVAVAVPEDVLEDVANVLGETAETVESIESLPDVAVTDAQPSDILLGEDQVGANGEDFSQLNRAAKPMPVTLAELRSSFEQQLYLLEDLERAYETGNPEVLELRALLQQRDETIAELRAQLAELRSVVSSNGHAKVPSADGDGVQAVKRKSVAVLPALQDPITEVKMFEEQPAAEAGLSERVSLQQRVASLKQRIPEKIKGKQRLYSPELRREIVVAYEDAVVMRKGSWLLKELDINTALLIYWQRAQKGNQGESAKIEEADALEENAVELLEGVSLQQKVASLKLRMPEKTEGKRRSFSEELRREIVELYEEAVKSKKGVWLLNEFDIKLALVNHWQHAEEDVTDEPESDTLLEEMNFEQKAATLKSLIPPKTAGKRRSYSPELRRDIVELYEKAVTQKKGAWLLRELDINLALVNLWQNTDCHEQDNNTKKVATTVQEDELQQEKTSLENRVEALKELIPPTTTDQRRSFPKGLRPTIIALYEEARKSRRGAWLLRELGMHLSHIRSWTEGQGADAKDLAEPIVASVSDPVFPVTSIARGPSNALEKKEPVMPIASPKRSVDVMTEPSIFLGKKFIRPSMQKGPMEIEISVSEVRRIEAEAAELERWERGFDKEVGTVMTRAQRMLMVSQFEANIGNKVEQERILLENNIPLAKKGLVISCVVKYKNIDVQKIQEVMRLKQEALAREDEPARIIVDPEAQAYSVKGLEDILGLDYVDIEETRTLLQANRLDPLAEHKLRMLDVMKDLGPSRQREYNTLTAYSNRDEDLRRDLAKLWAEHHGLNHRHDDALTMGLMVQRQAEGAVTSHIFTELAEKYFGYPVAVKLKPLKRDRK